MHHHHPPYYNDYSYDRTYHGSYGNGNSGNNNYNNNNGYGNGNNNGHNNGYSNNIGNPINRNSLNNNPNNDGAGPSQNMPNNTLLSPLVYTIPGQSENNSMDSTEIIFTNPYLIIGVENLLLYGEFHDEMDIKIIIQQDSDGLEPYPSIPFDESNATSSVNGTAPNQLSNNTTTIKNGMNTGFNTTTTVPLAPMP